MQSSGNLHIFIRQQQTITLSEKMLLLVYENKVVIWFKCLSIQSFEYTPQHVRSSLPDMSLTVSSFRLWNVSNLKCEKCELVNGLQVVSCRKWRQESVSECKRSTECTSRPLNCCRCTGTSADAYMLQPQRCLLTSENTFLSSTRQWHLPPADGTVTISLLLLSISWN